VRAGTDADVAVLAPVRVESDGEISPVLAERN
jgi:hypothetical protein